METVLYICASVALLALAGLFVFLIIFVSGTKDLLASVTGTMRELMGEVSAIRGSLQGTIVKLNDSVDRINGQLDQIEGIVESVKDVSQDVSRLTSDATDVIHGAKNIVVSVIGFVDNVQQQVQRPVNEVMAILGAVSTGIHRFRMKLGGAELDGTAAGGDGRAIRSAERSSERSAERSSRMVSGSVNAPDASMAPASATRPSGIYAE